MRNRILVPLALVLFSSAGCAGVPTVSANPLVIPFDDFDYVWQQTVEVVDEYFEIVSENRVEGRIETHPLVAATLLEPWRNDSVDKDERLEATLQTIRRRAFVHLSPTADGYAVRIEVHKELEDLPHPTYATTGDAIFRTEFSLHREQQVVGPLPVARGWIHQGRDWKLESRILGDLACRFGVR